MTKSLNSIISLGFFAIAGLMLFSGHAMAQPVIANGSLGEGCTQGTLGGMICDLIDGTVSLPGIVAGLAYMAGLICGFLGVLKLKQHVEAPSQTEIWDPIKRFVAGGAFFSLPYVAGVLRKTIEGDGAVATGTGFSGSVSDGGLDAMIVNLMSNMLAPTIAVVGWLGFVAGIIFVFIGISRLMQTEQQGARGPTGIGTIGTFVIAGCLFSLNSIIAFINNTLFDSSVLTTNGTLQYSAGLEGASGHVHAVISAIIAFSIILGWISVARGLFIVRDVGEGNSQASMMAAITHLIGGVLAINLGSVINAVQKTLGIETYGILFK